MPPKLPGLAIERGTSGGAKVGSDIRARDGSMRERNVVFASYSQGGGQWTDLFNVTGS